jgi:cell shape-determining protein MreC
MSDLVEWLNNPQPWETADVVLRKIKEAADRIDALEAENRRLEAQNAARLKLLNQKDASITNLQAENERLREALTDIRIQGNSKRGGIIDTL